MYKQIYLKRGKEESLKRFHPWIFSGAIHHADEGIEEGDIVRVITSSGEFIAIGHLLEIMFSLNNDRIHCRPCLVFPRHDYR